MSSLNSRGTWNYSQGANVRYVGSLASGTPNQDQQGSIKMQDLDACSKVFVHVESQQIRDVEKATNASTTATSDKESSIERDSS
ncbi:hypothetical protein PM082_017303 [Marasmius tenuissimus]|nr:hypothetical protein PM082_017303 [Marasmius tenuissimus]